MRKWSRYVVGVVAVTGLFVLVTHAGAESCKLELKKVDTSPRTSSSGPSLSYLARSTYAQSFFQQLGGPAGMVSGSGSGAKKKFSDVIKKEPKKYVSDTPFRGVAKLGSGYYGFVLDVAPPDKDEEKAKEKAKAVKETDKKKDSKKANEKKESKKTDQKKVSTGSFFSMLKKALVPALPEPPKPKNVGYTRLYFDLNHNGDLTDDKVIEAESSYARSSTTRATFPTVEVTIEVDGKKLDYAFTFSVYSHASSSYSYANASLRSAAYREGEITLDGKKRRIMLIDFNSNGRFDDAASIRDDVRGSNGTVYPRMGDMLYIDPKVTQGYRNPYDPTSGEDQHQVGKLICMSGRFFDLKIDPAGETLSLERSSIPVGYVTNANKGFRAQVYGDRGILTVSPDDSGKAPLPAGKWNLMSYTINKTAAPKPKSEAKKKDEKKSALGVIGGMLTSSRPRRTLVSARGTGDSKPVKVVTGKTVEMRFGPPYKPQVNASNARPGQKTISLGMSLVGCGGEVCSAIYVNGSRPSAPKFTISTKDGKEVAAGKFKYG